MAPEVGNVSGWSRLGRPDQLSGVTKRGDRGLGLSDAFRLLPARPEAGAFDHLEEPGTSRADSAARPAAPVGDPGGCWVPAGQATEVAGLTLPGGMIYVGEGLPTTKGDGPDPALINPLLPVDLSDPDWAGASVGYWPSYAGISPGARAAYLKWLADGRPGLGVPIGWVFLYFYGLERRVVIDGAAAARAGELPDIADEVRRLRDYCRHHGSFHAYATQFLALLDAVSAAAEPPGGAPRSTGSRWPIPYRLRVGLGRLAADGTPVPAGWALSWIHFHPDIHPRTPAERCPAEFGRLARARYATRHGAGLLVTGGTPLEHVYMAANVGIGQVTVSLGVPDVLQLPGPARDLKALAEDCSEALDAYSRYLGRHPGLQETLAATALLPPELADHGTEAMRDLRGWLDSRLAGRPRVLVDSAEFSAFWPAEAGGGLARGDALSLTRLLEGQGIGVEPDVRLGGAAGLGSGPVVLFRLADGGRPAVSRTVYATATVVLHLAAAVALADGPASAAARRVLQAHVQGSMAAPAAARLQAHLEWLLAGEVKLTGLARRVAILDEEERAGVAELLVSVAATEALVSPAAINALTRSFRLLGRDPATVYSAVHARGAGPATAPVVVRPGADRPPGAVVPPPPAAPPADVRLDSTVIAAKLAETATVSALLGSIFTGEDAAPGAPVPGPGAATADVQEDFERETAPSQPGIAGLDGAHSALLRTITTRDSWPRAEMQEACAAVALMLDGALDTLNEAAYEVAGDPLTDGDDPIYIDQSVAQEMLA